MSQIPQTEPLPSPIFVKQISTPRKKKYPTCPKCALIFSKEMDLKLHLESEEWDEYKVENYSENFSCEECCLFFETKKGYSQHKGKIHNRQHKNSICKVCKKRFKNKYAVRYHIKQVHDKLTREKCPTCGKDFYNKYLIPDHLLKCSINGFKELINNRH